MQTSHRHSIRRPTATGFEVSGVDEDDRMERTSSDYELIDAGDGRRLERFGDRIVDRPAPGAAQPIADPAIWASADFRFDRDRGWEAMRGRLEPWTINLDGPTFELRLTDSGQVGVFPEQAVNWRFLRDNAGPDQEVLNLFAYTGGSTLAAAAAGASVVDVDASRPGVSWARRNAVLSGLGDRPIRWIVEDVEAFVQREIRRGRSYDGIVLDPPSYGHGRGGAVWRLDDGLPALLDACARIANRDAFVILTAHAAGIDAQRLADELSAAFGSDRPVETEELELTATSGARIWLGSCARIMPER
jgi:23S rRNA (cytosine1962-C5)-methyltransferase